MLYPTELYAHKTVSGSMERVKRIELSRSAWKADVLPLNYTRRIPETLDMIQQVLTFVKYELKQLKASGQRKRTDSKQTDKDRQTDRQTANRQIRTDKSVQLAQSIKFNQFNRAIQSDENALEFLVASFRR